MQFSKATDYGLLGLAYLARQENGSASVSEIATSEQLALAFLRKIFQRLAAAGLVTSQRGSGYTLARAAKKITAREVFEAVDGPIALQSCLDSARPCAKSASCRLAPVWTTVQHSLNTQLEKIKISDLI